MMIPIGLWKIFIVILFWWLGAWIIDDRITILAVIIIIIIIIIILVEIVVSKIAERWVRSMIDNVIVDHGGMMLQNNTLRLIFVLPLNVWYRFALVTLGISSRSEAGRRSWRRSVVLGTQVFFRVFLECTPIRIGFRSRLFNEIIGFDGRHPFIFHQIRH